jgi:hypothetical protein
MKAQLFQCALKEKPAEAMQMLREEVQKALKINLWKPIHLNDLTREEKKLIIPTMLNYLEKYKPDNTFGKYKYECSIKVRNSLSQGSLKVL